MGLLNGGGRSPSPILAIVEKLQELATKMKCQENELQNHRTMFHNTIKLVDDVNASTELRSLTVDAGAHSDDCSQSSSKEPDETAADDEGADAPPVLALPALLSSLAAFPEEVATPGPLSVDRDTVLFPLVVAYLHQGACDRLPLPRQDPLPGPCLPTVLRPPERSNCPQNETLWSIYRKGSVTAMAYLEFGRGRWSSIALRPPLPCMKWIFMGQKLYSFSGAAVKSTGPRPTHLACFDLGRNSIDLLAPLPADVVRSSGPTVCYQLFPTASESIVLFCGSLLPTEYCLRREVWIPARLPPLPQPPKCVCCIGGVFYATAGPLFFSARRGDKAWRTLPDLPWSCNQLAHEPWRGRVVAIGGWHDRKSCHSVLLFDPKTETMRDLPYLPSGCICLDANVAGDNIYISGHVWTENKMTHTRTLFRLNPSRGSWVVVEDYPFHTDGDFPPPCELLVSHPPR